MSKKHFSILWVIIILLFSGCSASEVKNSTPAIFSSSSVEQTSENQTKEPTVPAQLRLLSKSGNGAVGVSTQTGYYELAIIGDTASNILYTDFTTHTRVFLCNRPDCLHQDETCTSFVEGSCSLFSMKDKLGMIRYGTTDVTAPDADRRTRVYSLNYDGSQRTEIFAMDPALSVFSGIVTDEENLYFMAIVLDAKHPGKESPELVKVDLSTGEYTSLQQYDYPPHIGGIVDNCLILEDAYEKSGKTFFRYCTLTLPDCREHLFFESPIQCTIQDDQVYQVDIEGKRIQVISPKTGEITTWPLEMDVSAEDYITGGSHEVPLPGYTSFHVFSRDTGKESKYLIELATGKTIPLQLTYTWYDGSEKTIYILAVPNQDTLLVINRCELEKMNYLSEGDIISHDMLRSYYAFLPFDDYLSSVPNYTPIEDMLGELFIK